MDSTQLPDTSGKTLSQNIRRRFGMESTEEKDQKAKVDKASRIFNYLVTARRRTEYEWWLNDQFMLGEQYTTFNRSAGSVTTNTSADERVTINKIAANGRYVVMWLNRDHPTPKVRPGTPEPEAYLRAKRNERYLDDQYDRQQLSKKYKQVTFDGYRYKLGFVKILWDTDALAPTAPYTSTAGQLTTQTRGSVIIDRVDPFEVYLDPMAHGVDDARFIAHALPRTLGELRNNPIYMNRDKLSGDQKLAQSFMKEAQIKAQTVGAAQFAPGGNDDMATVIVRELFFREFDKTSSKWQIHLMVTTSNGVLLRDQVWPLDFFPFEMFLADVQGSPLDGGGPVRHLRSPQKALNQFNSYVQENGRLMSKINYIIPRNANVNVITDEAGQFLEFDPTPAGKPEQMTPANMPAYVNQHIDRMEKYIDDLGGNHAASYGRSPGSKASGELVNRLQEGDSNNLLLMRDNLDDFQTRVARKDLLTFKANAKVDRHLRSKAPNAVGVYDFSKFTADDIKIDDDIKIITGTNMPYSLADRQDLLFNMKKEGIIEAPEFIKAINLPDLDSLLNTQEQDIERAIKENAQLLAGKTIDTPARQEDHSVHLQVHTQLVKSEAFLEAKPAVKDAVQAHIDAHIALNYQLAMISASMNVEPIKRSEAIMYRPNSFSEMSPIERTQIFGKFGIQSDAAQIQMRGGLNVEDPAAAEQQAMAEDMRMMDGVPQLVGVTDNHQVHIETHSKIQETGAWEVLPEPVKRMFDKHIQDHITTMQSQTSQPGLVPQDGYDLPIQPQLFHDKAAAPTPDQPTNKAAMDPHNPVDRPMMDHEFIQHKSAVKHQRASEKMAVQAEQQAQKEKAAQAKLKATTKKPANKPLNNHNRKK